MAQADTPITRLDSTIFSMLRLPTRSGHADAGAPHT